MDRKEFLKLCGAACIGLTGASRLSSCTSARQVHGLTRNNRIEIDKNAFEIIKGDKIRYRKNIVVKPEHLDYPIVLYRFSETDYSALLLRCTHQNSELNLNGDIMTCSAHDSEFNNHGEVIQGPAEQKLQAFPVSHDLSTIYIHLT